MGDGVCLCSGDPEPSEELEDLCIFILCFLKGFDSSASLSKGSGEDLFLIFVKSNTWYELSTQGEGV